MQIYIFQLPPARAILSTENKLNSVKYDIYAKYDNIQYTIGLTNYYSLTLLPPTCMCIRIEVELNFKVGLIFLALLDLNCENTMEISPKCIWAAEKPLPSGQKCY